MKNFEIQPPFITDYKIFKINVSRIDYFPVIKSRKLWDANEKIKLYLAYKINSLVCCGDICI